jgi:hypothetical protein
VIFRTEIINTPTCYVQNNAIKSGVRAVLLRSFYRTCFFM